jgi:hypothetical protein
MAMKRAEMKSKAADERRCEWHHELRKVPKRTGAETTHGVTGMLLGNLKVSADVEAVASKIKGFMEKGRMKVAEYNAWKKAHKAKSGRHPVPTALFPSHQRTTQAARDEIAPFLITQNTEGGADSGRHRFIGRLCQPRAAQGHVDAHALLHAVARHVIARGVGSGYGSTAFPN